MDRRAENRLFTRIFVGTCALVAAMVLFYWLFGETLLRSYCQSKGIAITQPGGGFDEAAFAAYWNTAAWRFWHNLVLGIPLSLLTIFGLYRLYAFFFARLGEDHEASDLPGGSRWVILWAGGLYALIALVYFSPTLPTFLTAMIGPPEDNMQNYWVQTWAWQNVLHGHKSLSYITDIYYPEGRSSYYHTWSFYNLFLSFGLRQFLNPVATYNTLILLSFPLAGIGAFLLTRMVTRNPWLALLGGFLFAFNPAHFVRALHHLNIASIQFIPFFIYFFIKAMRGEGRWSLALATVFFVLNALTDWNYLFYGLFFLLFAYLYLAIRRRRVILLDMIWKSAIVTGVTFIAISWWMVPMLQLGMAQGGVRASGHNQFVVDLLAFITPNPDHLLGSLFEGIRVHYTSLIWEGTGYVGIPALVLVILAGRPLVTVLTKYLLGGISFALMALGAQPHFLGVSVPALIPGRIVQELPVLTNARCPGRNMAIAYLFWAVVVATGVGILWQRLRQTRWRLAFLVAVPILLVADYFSICHESTPVMIPPCYAQLQAEAQPFGILDLPSGYERVNRYMMYQSQHGIPIVQGWFSRKTGSSLIDSLDYFDLPRQREQLSEARVKYVILHKIYLPNDSVNVEDYRQAYPMTYEDTSNIVLQVY